MTSMMKSCMTVLMCSVQATVFPTERPSDTVAQMELVINSFREFFQQLPQDRDIDTVDHHIWTLELMVRRDDQKKKQDRKEFFNRWAQIQDWRRKAESSEETVDNLREELAAKDAMLQSYLDQSAQASAFLTQIRSEAALSAENERRLRVELAAKNAELELVIRQFSDERSQARTILNETRAEMAVHEECGLRISHELAVKDTQLAIAHNATEAGRARIAELELNLDTANAMHERERSKCAYLEPELAASQLKIIQLNQTLTNTQVLLKQTEAKSSGLAGALESKNKRIAELEKEMKNKTAKLQKARSQHYADCKNKATVKQAWKAKVEGLEAQIGDLAKKSGRLEGSLKLAEANRETLRQATAQNDHVIATLKGDIQNFEAPMDDDSALQREVEQSRTQLHENLRAISSELAHQQTQDIEALAEKRRLEGELQVKLYDADSLGASIENSRDADEFPEQIDLMTEDALQFRGKANMFRSSSQDFYSHIRYNKFLRCIAH